MTHGTSTADTIANYREAATALRRITSGDGRTGATTNAIARRTAQRDTAAAELCASGHRRIVGLLVEENTLAQRIAEARRANQTRPELAARLRAVRAALRAA